MTDRRLIGLFVGVPDGMLRAIGLIVVLCARLDHLRMQLLEAAEMIPVTTSAHWPQRRVTEALEQTFSSAPLNAMQGRVMPWLAEGESLFRFRDELVHSTGGHEVRGDGSARFVREHPRQSGTYPQRTAEELDDIVHRLVDATGDGVVLRIDVMVLVEHGLAAYEDLIRQRRDPAAERERLLEEALRAAQVAAGENGENSSDRPATELALRRRERKVGICPGRRPVISRNRRLTSRSSLV